MLTIICPNCKNHSADDIQFCTTCGLNLALLIPSSPSNLLKGEKIYLVLIGLSILVEVILFSSRRGDFFMNPLYFIAPLLLGFFQDEQYTRFGAVSSTFRKFIWLLILITFVIFIWESEPGDPLRDAILIFLGPIIFAMILLMFGILNLIMYSIGRILFNIFRKS